MEDTYKILCLNELVELEYADIDLAQVKFTKDGKEITASKVDNAFTINSSDDRSFIVLVNASKEEVEKDDRKEIYLSHDVIANYWLNADKALQLHSNIGLDEGYKPFTNIMRHDLFQKYGMSVYNSEGKVEGSISTTFNDVRIDDNPETFHFEKDNIETHDFKLTGDGKEIIEYRGEPIPSKEVVDSFDADNLIKKARILRMTDSFAPIDNEVEDAIIRRIESKKVYFDGIKEYYKNGVKDTEKAIKLRNDVLNGYSNFITSEELKESAKALGEELAKRRENNKKLEELGIAKTLKKKS